MTCSKTVGISESAIRVFWSEEDLEFVAVHPKFASLSYLDADRRKAKRGMRKLLKDVVADLRAEARKASQV